MHCWGFDRQQEESRGASAPRPAPLPPCAARELDPCGPRISRELTGPEGPQNADLIHTCVLTQKSSCQAPGRAGHSHETTHSPPPTSPARATMDHRAGRTGGDRALHEDRQTRRDKTLGLHPHSAVPTPTALTGWGVAGVWTRCPGHLVATQKPRGPSVCRIPCTPHPSSCLKGAPTLLGSPI